MGETCAAEHGHHICIRIGAVGTREAVLIRIMDAVRELQATCSGAKSDPASIYKWMRCCTAVELGGMSPNTIFQCSRRLRDALFIFAGWCFLESRQPGVRRHPRGSTLHEGP